MNSGRTVFAQVMELLPRRAFDLAVQRYDADRKVIEFSCMDQLLCMVFAQITGRSSLRETVSCLGALGTRRYHCGIHTTPAKSTLSRWFRLRELPTASLRNWHASHAARGHEDTQA